MPGVGVKRLLDEWRRRKDKNRPVCYNEYHILYYAQHGTFYHVTIIDGTGQPLSVRSSRRRKEKFTDGRKHTNQCGSTN